MKLLFIGLFIAIFIVCGFLKNPVQGENKNIKPTPTITPSPQVSPQTTQGVGNGRGRRLEDGIGNGNSDGNNSQQQITTKTKSKKITSNLNIVSKPKPNYTDLARQKNIQGTVKLKITFKANGTIGAVVPVETLPYGLTEQAISAAKRIQFEPAMKKGKTITVKKILVYTFTIY